MTPKGLSRERTAHKQLDNVEQALSAKLAYEWKFIFRQLVNIDTYDTGQVDLYDFDRICLDHKINLTKEELNKLKRRYCSNQDVDPNFTYISAETALDN